MNMFLHELRSNRKTTIIWACSIAAIIILFMAMFPGIQRDTDVFKKMLENYPEAIRRAFGSSIDRMTSLSGFYSFILIFVTLSGAIQALNLGLSMLSREAREKTADFLLTKPVSRARIITSKLMACMVLLLATNVFIYISGIIAVAAAGAKGYDAKLFFMLTTTLLLTQLMFFALGVLISVFFQKLSSVVSISMGLAFIFFFAGAMLVEGENDPARFLSPFKYFDVGYIMDNYAYEGKYLIAGGIFIIAAIAVSYIIYGKKDIHAVY